MARFIDESFEGTGYEESWTETGTPNEDSTGPGTLPSGGGSQCLAVTGSSDAYATRDTGSARSTSYSRVYVYFTSITAAAGLEYIFLQLQTGGNNTIAIAAYSAGGSTFVFRAAYHTSAGWQYIADTNTISTGQWYRIEFAKTSAGAVEFRVNGTTIGNATGVTLDRGDPQAWVVGARWVNGTTSATAYFDLVAVDDTTWVGAESAPGAAKPALMNSMLRRRRIG